MMKIKIKIKKVIENISFDINLFKINLEKESYNKIIKIYL